MSSRFVAAGLTTYGVALAVYCLLAQRWVPAAGMVLCVVAILLPDDLRSAKWIITLCAAVLVVLSLIGGK